MDPDYPTRFSEALISEIKAEMGRRDMSSRALARAIDANAQYVSSRLDGGNPRTGERVVLNVRDLFAIAIALNVDAADLIQRAEAYARETSNAASDFALAASDDPDWQERQEWEAELP